MNVEFNDPNSIQRVNFGGEKVPKLAGWLISKGLAKDVSGANKIQLGMSILFFALAIFFAIK